MTRAAIRLGTPEILALSETSLGTYAVGAQPSYAGPGRPSRVSGRAQERTLSLPMHTGLTRAGLPTVVAALRDERAGGGNR